MGPTTSVMPVLPSVEVTGNEVPVTPEKNRKLTSHFKYTRILLSISGLTVQSVPSIENRVKNPVISALNF